jgi:hypothetical protein
MSKCLFLCLVATGQTISMTTSIIQQTASRQSLFVFFFSLEQFFNSIQAKFIAVCDSREHYFIISACRAFIFTRKNDNLLKRYVAGNILCEFHTCFLPEDRICVNSREHVI